MYRPDKSGTGEIILRRKNWSEIKDDIARLIVTKLWFYPHHRKFATVCSDWYRIAKEVHGPFQPNSTFLLLPYNNERETCTLYGISKSETCEFTCPGSLLRDKFVHGSCNGWVAVDDKNLELSLINPLTRQQSALPPAYTIGTDINNDEDWNSMFEPGIRCTILTKFALSDYGLLSNDCIIAGVISSFESLYTCRLGDNSWTPIKVTNPEPSSSDLCDFIHDVLFFKGKLCAIRGGSNLIIVEFYDSNYMARSIRGPNYQKGDKFMHPTKVFLSTENLFVQRMYLVECSGKLLAVRKIGELLSDEITTKTRFFQLFLLEEETETWKMITGLGEKSLFLGQNNSISVSAKEIPGCKPNCIYFSEDLYKHQHRQESGIGVYSLEDGTVEVFNISQSVVHWEYPAVWYQLKM